MLELQPASAVSCQVFGTGVHGTQACFDCNVICTTQGFAFQSSCPWHIPPPAAAAAADAGRLHGCKSCVVEQHLQICTALHLGTVQQQLATG